jgi:hypothetical protein
MKFVKMSARPLIIASALLSVGFAANALTIPFNAFKGTSQLQFSADALGAFDLVHVVIAPLGNATAVPDTPGTFDLPITSITINPTLKAPLISAGSAAGSALSISRLNGDVTVGLTLANFTLNYIGKQVLADTTPFGGATTAQMPLYNFNNATPLALKYKFPLTITGHEVLDTLILTTEGKNALKASLVLPKFTYPILDETLFGTLTQDIATVLRKKPVSAKSYNPAP